MDLVNAIFMDLAEDTFEPAKHGTAAPASVPPGCNGVLPPTGGFAYTAYNAFMSGGYVVDLVLVQWLVDWMGCGSQ